MTGTRRYERILQGEKRPYNDEGYDQDTIETKERPTQTNNVPTPLCTAPHSGINTSSTPNFLTCHQHSNSIGLVNIGRRPRMVGDDVKLPLFHGNKTKNPEQYWFLCEAICTVKQDQNDDINKGQLGTKF